MTVVRDASPPRPVTPPVTCDLPVACDPRWPLIPLCPVTAPNHGLSAHRPLTCVCTSSCGRSPQTLCARLWARWAAQSISLPELRPPTCHLQSSVSEDVSGWVLTAPHGAAQPHAVQCLALTFPGTSHRL